jgi:hypothetical protein
MPGPTTRRLRVTCGITATLLAAPTACGPAASDVGAPTTAPSTTRSAPPTAAPPPPGLAAVSADEQAGLTGRLLQFRRDVERRRLEVRLTAANAGLVVETLDLHAPGLTTAAASPHEGRLPARSGLDIAVVMGAADCTVAPGPPVAVVGLRDDTGARRTVDVALDDDGLVQQLHETDCAAQSLRQQADVQVTALTPLSTADGPVMRVTISLSRAEGSEPVQVTGTDSNTVYDIRAVDPLPTLRTTPSVAFSVDMIPARCDAHALGESYRTSLIGLRLAVGEGDPQPFVLTPEPDVRHRLETFAVDTCHAGGN